MILAIVIFAGASGPIAIGIAQDPFPSLAACEAFQRSMAEVHEARRQALSIQHNTPVRLIAFCHDEGRAA